MSDSAHGSILEARLIQKKKKCKKTKEESHTSNTNILWLSIHCIRTDNSHNLLTSCRASMLHRLILSNNSTNGTVDVDLVSRTFN